MKKRVLLVFIVFCTAISACKKPGGRLCCALPPPIGVYGKIDGKDWRATAITDTTAYDPINIYAKTDSDMLKFRLFRYDGVNDATYTVIKGAHGKLTYVLDKEVANEIKVTYGSGEKAGNIPNIWVTSNFNLTFKLATPTGDAAFDRKRVVFSNATLHYGLQN